MHQSPLMWLTDYKETGSDHKWSNTGVVGNIAGSNVSNE
jgi:hypothetical protein